MSSKLQYSIFAAKKSSNLSQVMSSACLIRTIGLYLFVSIILCLSLMELTPNAYATEDHIVPVEQSERRLSKVTVTANRKRGGSGIGFLSISGAGGYSPIGGYGLSGDEYFIALSCKRNPNNDSDLCKNLCWVFPESERCPASINNNRNNSDTDEKALPTVKVIEQQKNGDRRKLNLLNQSGPTTLILEPIEAIVPCYKTVQSPPMRFPKGTHQERNIVTGDFYTVQFDVEALYKFVREAAEELALPGTDGKAVDWRRLQEGGFYVYWNRKTGRFRIGRISIGELYAGSVRVDYEYDQKSPDEERIARLHTQPSGTVPSFQDIFSSKYLWQTGVLSDYGKEFIAAVKIDELGREYIELKMYDFLRFPWTIEKVDKYRKMVLEGTLVVVPVYQLAKHALEIRQNGTPNEITKFDVDCD